MSTERQIEANRRNAQKSTGPRTDNGKNRSRYNAVTHGMTASFDILPGEDAEALEARIDDWTADLQPRNEVERELIERAALASLQLERVERAHVARLTANILKATSGENEAVENEVHTLGARLFEDLPKPHGFLPGIVSDPNNPARLVLELESSAPGCCWLLDRWAELRSLLEREQAWQSLDKLRAVRLLGRYSLDVFGDPKVALVFVACHTIDSSGGELLHELWNALSPDELQCARQRLMGRRLDLVRPRDQVEARAALIQIIERAVARLETKAEAHRQRAERDAATAADRLGFDDSRKGELLRNYEGKCSRAFFRAIDTFAKVRLAGKAGNLVPPALAVESSTMPVAPVENENRENEPNFVAISDTEAESAAPIENENRENEPNFVAISDTETESAAPIENENRENEPNFVAISDTETESAVPVENEITENEPNSACTNYPTEVNNDDRKAKVRFRDDRKRCSSSRTRGCCPLRSHWRGSLNSMRPTSVFGVGRRCGSDRANRREYKSRTTSRADAKKHLVTGSGRSFYT
jgi:hypothetical protein